MKKIMILLKKVFFDSDSFLVESLDKLLSYVESTLETFFDVKLQYESFDDQTFSIIDKHDD